MQRQLNLPADYRGSGNKVEVWQAVLVQVSQVQLADILNVVTPTDPNVSRSVEYGVKELGIIHTGELKGSNKSRSVIGHRLDGIRSGLSGT